MKSKKSFLLAMISVAILAVILIFQLQSRPVSEKSTGYATAVSVGVTRAEYGVILNKIDVIGTLEGYQETDVISETNGKIVKLDAEVGDFVAVGSNIAEVERDLQEISLEQAKAQVAAARANNDKMSSDLNRVRNLYEQKSVSESQMECAVTAAKAALAQLAGAEAAARLARKNYDNTFLRTAIAGRLAQRFIVVGQMINPGSKIASIVDDRRMKLKAGVPEQYISRVKLGSVVSVESDAVPGRAFRGTVKSVALKADPQTRSFQVEIELANASDRPLKSGMFARAGIATTLNRRLLVIPAAALLETTDNLATVYVVDDSVAHLRHVTTGARNDSLVEIITGLADGELLVSFGQQNLVDGSLVRY